MGAIPALILAGRAGRGSRQPGEQQEKGAALPGAPAVFTGFVLGHLSVNPFQQGSALAAHPHSHLLPQGTLPGAKPARHPTLGCQEMWEGARRPVPTDPAPARLPWAHT